MSEWNPQNCKLGIPTKIVLSVFSAVMSCAFLGLLLNFTSDFAGYLLTDSNVVLSIRSSELREISRKTFSVKSQGYKYLILTDYKDHRLVVECNDELPEHFTLYRLPIRDGRAKQFFKIEAPCYRVINNPIWYFISNMCLILTGAVVMAFFLALSRDFWLMEHIYAGKVKGWVASFNFKHQSKLEECMRKRSWCKMLLKKRDGE